MRKYVILILITLIVCAIVCVYRVKIKRYYYLKTIDFSQGTGALHSPPNSRLIEERETVEKLQKLLPYNQRGFVIENYSYQNAKFWVRIINITPDEFYGWLDNSDFYPISRDRFEFGI